MSTELSIAFSPCPNDTFIFHGLVNKRFKSSLTLKPQYLDIAHLNELILGASSQGVPDVCKVSFAVLPEIMHDYIVLPVGAALGFDNGPKLVASRKLPSDRIEQIRDQLRAEEADAKKDIDFSLVSPGRQTTAMLLFKLFYHSNKQVSHALYDQIESHLTQGRAEVGLIIHETRFTLEDRGLLELADLGQIWQQSYELPLPLGCIVARRSLGKEVLGCLVSDIRTSIAYSRSSPADGLDYILTNSIEKDRKVVKSHIDLYVNQESCGLSKRGIDAVETLLGDQFKEDYGLGTATPWLFSD